MMTDVPGRTRSTLQPTLLADRMFFLLHDPRTGSPRLAWRSIHYAMGAAMLMELYSARFLIIREPIGTRDRYPGTGNGNIVMVVDPFPWMPNLAQHQVLAEINEPAPIGKWIRYLGSRALLWVAERMVHAQWIEEIPGISLRLPFGLHLSRQHHRWIAPTSYDGAKPGLDLVNRLDHGDQLTFEERALFALVDACDLTNVCFELLNQYKKDRIRQEIKDLDLGGGLIAHELGVLIRSAVQTRRR